MEGLGMRMRPASVELPLGISFPRHRRPALRVVASGNVVPRLERRPMLEIPAVNASGSPVRVEGVSSSVLYTALPTEILPGSRPAALPLRDLGAFPLPCMLSPGGSGTRFADLGRLANQTPSRTLCRTPLPLRCRTRAVAAPRALRGRDPQPHQGPGRAKAGRDIAGRCTRRRFGGDLRGEG